MTPVKQSYINKIRHQSSVIRSWLTTELKGGGGGFGQGVEGGMGDGGIRKEENVIVCTLLTNIPVCFEATFCLQNLYTETQDFYSPL